MRPFSRRDLLKAAGGALVVPTFVRQAFAAPGDRPPRLVLVSWQNGTNPASFWPGSDFRSPILAPLLDDARLRAVSTVVKDVNVTVAEGRGNAHDTGFLSFWTGVSPVGTNEDPWAGGPSIDQQLVRRLPLDVPFPSLNVGVLGAFMGPKNSHRRSYSYFGARQPVPTQSDPYRLYAALFRTPAGRDEDLPPLERAHRRLQRKQSVLDYVSADLRTLAGRLGPIERTKLEAHLEALRAFESRLAGSGGPAPSGRCAPPAPPAMVDSRREEHVPSLAAAMMDLVALALGCNLTGVVTVQMGYCGGQWRYDWLGIGKDAHEELAHKDDGSVPAVTAGVIQVGRWHAEQVARLARGLDAVPEEGGTALDRSLIVWWNENATGTHGLDGVPLVFVGTASGRLRAPGRLVAAGPQPHQRVGTTVLNAMGVEATGFGEATDCGPLPGVLG